MKKTFCSAPWFQTRIDWDGKYRPCCELNETKSNYKGKKQFSINDSSVDDWMSSGYAQYLRRELTEGNKLPECDRCWQSEKNSILSTRQISNNTVSQNKGNDLDNTWVRLFVDKNSKDYKNYHLLTADVKLSNVCNFACVMCRPWDSSKLFDRWKSDEKNIFVQEYLKDEPTLFDNIKTVYKSQKGHQHFKDILNNPVKHLKLLGGEPLLDKELFKILCELPDEKKAQINLHLCTNGSQDLVLATDKLTGFKSVDFSVSLEGVQHIQDYARQGSNWQVIEQNVLNAQKNKISVTIHYTMQALTILNLPELLNWCNDNRLSLSMAILTTPEYLSVSVLPKELRQQAIDSLENIDKMPNSVDKHHITSIENLKNAINGFSDQSHLYSKFLDYINWYEKDSVIKLKDIQPKFYEKLINIKDSSCQI